MPARPAWAAWPGRLRGLPLIGVVGGFVWSCLAFPWRQRQRRLGVQLLADNLLAGLISTVAIYGIVLAVLFGYIGSSLFFGENWDIDGTMGEKARTAGFILDPSAVAAAASGDMAARIALQDTLAKLVPSEEGAELPGGQITNPDGEPMSVPDRPPYEVLESVEYALVVGMDGTILASTDRARATPGLPIGTIEFTPLIEAAEQVVAADGGAVPGSMGSPYALGYRDSVTAGAFPIIGADGQMVGIVAVQGEPFDLSEFVSPGELIRAVLKDEWRSVLLFTGIGMVITLPIIFWRARVVSRRVKALAIAADSWAAGDLTRRAEVKGEDEIGRLGAHFNIMSERLAATDRARRAFVANVSHDLRTPVAIMRGHLERLQSLPADVPAEAAPLTAGVGASERGGAPPTGDTLIGQRPMPSEAVPVDPATIDLLHRETVTLGRLIDDLFTLARVEETQLPLELGPLNVAEPVTEAVEGLRQLAWTQSKVTVQSLIRPDLPLVMGDATRIRQILNNLIYNALRHTPAGGLVIVDAQEVAGETQVEVSVMDTGVGIPPEKLPSVFERFVHGDDSVRGKGEGSGLGLHIVKQLVEAQSGTITVESSLGQGTVFRFRLPRAVRPSGRGAERGRH
jgi:signal transduction histidine kinase